jgi:predicted secreted Zn-dependent protease
MTALAAGPRVTIVVIFPNPADYLAEAVDARWRRPFRTSR